jgi:ADP-ribosylglycohydrolase
MLYYWYLVWIVVTAIIYVVLVQLLPPQYRRSDLSNFLGNANEVTHTNALLVAFVSAIALVISLAVSGMQFTGEKEEFKIIAKEGKNDNKKEREEKEKKEKEAKEKKEKEAKEKREREANALKEKEEKLKEMREKEKQRQRQRESKIGRK